MSEGRSSRVAGSGAWPQKSAFGVDEVEAEEYGKVAQVVARRALASRRARVATASSGMKSTCCIAVSAPEPVDFVPLGVLGEVNPGRDGRIVGAADTRAAANLLEPAQAAWCRNSRSIGVAERCPAFVSVASVNERATVA